MTEIEAKVVSKKLPSSHVRFTDQEFHKIDRAARSIGRSIPWILKTAFFNSGELCPAFDKESARSLQVELNRIGNNINQIARQINQGLARGWNSEFEKINSQLTQIVQFMAVRLGNRKS